MEQVTSKNELKELELTRANSHALSKSLQFSAKKSYVKLQIITFVILVAASLVLIFW